jgi:aldehyde dehydrogenase (NAD+)
MTQLALAPTPALHYEFDKLLVGDTWRPGRSSLLNRDSDPWSGETLTTIPEATVEDVDDAYAAAVVAQASWARTLPGERASVLRKAAAILETRH